MSTHQSPPPSRHRRSLKGLQDLDHAGSDEQTLPAPNTYSQFKRNKEMKEKGTTPGIKPAGESGRKGFHPFHFFKISFRSTSRASLLCNILWPVVPAAIAVRYTLPDHHVLIFTLAYIAMIPCANLIGFAGQELGRKLPHVAGVLTEITLGSVVEIVLFMVLLSRDQVYVIQAAILGSILATMVLCLGFCFFVGGLTGHEQSFDDTISETGSGLLLTAGVALGIPTIFRQGLASANVEEMTQESLDHKVLMISRIVAILLIVAYAVYVFFQARSHHSIYNNIFERDEHRDRDGHKDAAKAKLTLTECAIALAVSITLVTIIAIMLVLQIEPIIEKHTVSDAFVGLILVPLVEKFAEHLTAIDEAWDDQMNFALSHVLGATLQTAMFNGPLVVIVGWGLSRRMDLSFDVFNLAMLILAILTVGRFLQDQKSNYFEGFLLIILYMAIAVAAYYYPNPAHGLTAEGSETSTEGGGH